MATGTIKMSHHTMHTEAQIHFLNLVGM